MNLRELFFRHVAQTSPAPLAFEIVKAEGCELIDVNGKKYIDLIGGISVANTGHRHPKVVQAIKSQLDQYLHVMVYGEFVESPQVKYAKLLAKNLPPSLDSVYFTNSGAEATEGALKLAKRSTNRTGIISFNNSYHGSTHGALSVMGDEEWRNAFRPLLPGVLHFDYNSNDVFDSINSDTACVIVEPIQAEAGVNQPSPSWLKALRKKCNETGTLLMFDEIQTGFGRTGKLWAFEHYDVTPDILLLGKALGGGMPLGAFIDSKERMNTLTSDPVLGHITTFGGHPVSCAAGMAAFEVLLDELLINEVEPKSKLFLSLLNHPGIRSIRHFGLWFAIQIDPSKMNKVISSCIDKGVITDWFLFAPDCLRISPPLTITESQIREACKIILHSLDQD